MQIYPKIYEKKLIVVVSCCRCCFFLFLFDVKSIESSASFRQSDDARCDPVGVTLETAS